MLSLGKSVDSLLLDDDMSLCNKL